MLSLSMLDHLSPPDSRPTPLMQQSYYKEYNTQLFNYSVPKTIWGNSETDLVLKYRRSGDIIIIIPGRYLYHQISDMTEVYKILTNKYDNNVNFHLELCALNFVSQKDGITRGHSLKLVISKMPL